MAKTRSRTGGSGREVAKREKREAVTKGKRKRSGKGAGGWCRRRFPKMAKRVDAMREKRELRRLERVQPHRSFRRSYREDYRRELEVPGIMYHVCETFRQIFKNWRLFLPLLVIAVVLNVVLVGLMSESTYTQFQEALDETDAQIAGNEIGAVAKAGLLLISSITTGGLAGEDSEASAVFMVIVFLLLWLVTIYLLRHRLAGQKVKLRDGLYNALTPLISTFLVFAVGVVQCLPVMLLVIVYSTAVETEFLATPFYALVFFIFAAVMILLTAYLLSSTLIALVAVTAPGLWPSKAIQAANDIMMGRRVRFILRLVALFMAMAVVWVVVMLPIILVDLALKRQFTWMNGFPLVPICLNVMTCFTIIYCAAYLYLYYRWMLDYEEK